MMYVLIVLCIVAMILFLVNTYVPMDPKLRSILNVIVVILVLLWLLGTFNVITIPRH